MVSQYGIKFAVHLITSHFGNLVAKVCEKLLCSGPLTLEQLIRYTELSREHVKNSLLVLIQHNCVQAFVYEGGDVDPLKVRTQYLVLFDNILHRLRFPKFLEIVSRELGEDSEDILDGLLRDGRLTLKQIVERASQLKENAVAPDVVRESLCKLLTARYVERCPAPELAISKVVEEENTTRKRGAKSAKIIAVPETIEQRVIEAAKTGEAIRFSLTADMGCTSDREIKSEDSQMISVGENDAREELILWRANFEELIRNLRHKVLIENVRTRMDDGAAVVLSAILEATKTVERKVKIEKTEPLTLDTIFTEVMKTENGRTMTIDRVKACLVQFGCSKLVDEYSIDLEGIILSARNEEVESIVLKRYGRDAYRMFRHLSKEKRFCPTDKIADATLVEKREAPKLLYKLWNDNYLRMEKLVVMASKQIQLLMWKVNEPPLWEYVLDEMYHAALNLTIRIAFEKEKDEELLNVPREKLWESAPLQKKYKRLQNVCLLLGSSLMKLDDAMMLFHDF